MTTKRKFFLGLSMGLATAGLWFLLAGIPPWMVAGYTGLVNRTLVFESSQTLSAEEFETLARDLTREFRQKKAEEIVQEDESPFARRLKVEMLMNTRSFLDGAIYPHIDHFRKAGIRRYDGPSTCLTCHPRMKVAGGEGVTEVETLEDVVESVHYKFQSTAPGFSTFGFDGREVNAAGSRAIPVGKIDRACGIPGTFSWTGWAELIRTRPEGKGEVVRSEGCGQCHIGGNYHPATEKMLPFSDVPAAAKEGIDCLICHADHYDLNFRHVIEDEGGRRWNQDRSLRAALTVGKPELDNCLACHQHNMGGDTFEGNEAARQLGYQNPRLLHAGAKRANPMSADTDVHAAAGMTCTDCHVPEGHKIPRGAKGTDLVANDLPGKVVACESCHTAAPHIKGEDRAILNGHGDRVACETCHISRLEETSVVLRDWTHPEWNGEEGIYQPVDLYRSGKPGKGLAFLWFNGNGTFLANPLGDNPQGGGRYNPLMDQLAVLDDAEVVAAVRQAAEGVRARYPELDVEAYVTAATRPLTQLTPAVLAQRATWIEEKIRPLMGRGKSKLYPFKLFNARMFEDLGNEGPFGAMILPFDYPSYYERGNALLSLKAALGKPIMRRMYERPFKEYMMDEFMNYFGVKEWSGRFPMAADGALTGVEGRWMRQMGALMVNHGIEREGRACIKCHARKGIIDFESLGYSPERVVVLRNLPELAP